MAEQKKPGGIRMCWRRWTAADDRSGLWPALAGAALLGLVSQLIWLADVSWSSPAARLAGGLLAGLFLGALLVPWLMRGLVRLGLLRREKPYFSLGWALLAVGMAFALFWPWLGTGKGLLLLLALGAGVAALLEYAARSGGGEARKKALSALGLAGILLLAFCLRLPGINHGIPEYVAHCDTPKQISIIPQFVDGNLHPGTDYPLGHIYLYSYLMRAWRTLAGISAPLPRLPRREVGPAAGYLLAARTMQAAAGTMVVLFVFLAARRLWDTPVALLAALLMAMDPVHQTYSRQLMGEVPQAMWMMACLYFAARLYTGGGARDIFLAGVACGLAVATKIYGGYMILAPLAAAFFSGYRPRRHLWLLLPGLFLGVFLLTPVMWLDPQAWWRYNFGQALFHLGKFDSAGGGTGVTLSRIWGGLDYLWRAMVHRYHLPWMIITLGGLAFLTLRRRAGDRLFLVPALAGIGLILVFRLIYLREWDFIHFTPYLAMAGAAWLAALYRGTRENSVRRKAVALVCTVFLVFQAMIAAGEGWLATLPDTRELARRWVISRVEPGSRLVFDTHFSAAHALWVPEESGLVLIRSRINRALTKPGGMKRYRARAAVMERVWWEGGPADAGPAPKMIFRTRNTYWENPEIRAYLYGGNQKNPARLTPAHLRLARPGPAFVFTKTSRQAPLDLSHLHHEAVSRVVFGPLGPDTGFMVMGWGKARLFFGPSLARPLEVKGGGLAAGFLRPVPCLVPVSPAVYRFRLEPQPKTRALWVGLYPDPGAMAPMLARYKKWRTLARAARLGLKASPQRAELHLWLGLAAAATGDKTEAARRVELIKKSFPGFLPAYRRMAASPPGEGRDMWLKLVGESLMQATRDRVYWAAQPKGDLAELVRQKPRPRVEKTEGGFHIWMGPSFLPGFFKATITARGGDGGGELKIVAFRHHYFHAVLARAKLAAGLNRLVLRGAVPVGPVGLEVIIKAKGGAPAATSILLEPDLAAEARWRWGLFKKHLPGLDS